MEQTQEWGESGLELNESRVLGWVNYSGEMERDGSGPGILVGLWLGMRVCCQVGDEDKTGAWDWPWEQSGSSVSGAGQQGEGRVWDAPGQTGKGGRASPWAGSGRR